MKDKAMGYGLWIAAGLVIVALAIPILTGFIRESVNTPEGKQPNMPESLTYEAPAIQWDRIA